MKNKTFKLLGLSALSLFCLAACGGSTSSATPSTSSTAKTSSVAPTSSAAPTSSTTPTSSAAPTSSGTPASSVAPASSSQEISSADSSTQEESSVVISSVAQVFTVNFSLNYDGAPAMDPVSVNEGETVERPSDPTRTGYLFNGWFSDAETTATYDFGAPVTGDLTIYAGWQEGSQDDYNIVTYHYNYDDAPNDGVYLTQNYKKKRKATRPTAPSRDGYYFYNWYTDAECTTVLDFDKVLTGNVDAYAEWKLINVFEAEDTDFEDKNGFGYSGNVAETEMICTDTDDLGASNGYFVSYLYYNGAFLEWDIDAAEACDNVVLIARLSAEFFDITVSPDTYKITVNDTTILNYSFELTGVEGTMKKLPFEDFLVSTTVSLNEGTNVIKLTTNNSTAHPQAGTYKAEAPMIDCIKLCTNTTLDFTPVEDNY